uniref:Dolichyl-diphosphooligosaccharide--protein glycosyltransferase subunit OST2 n=1 Tax=Phaeomonas parva TaxID=124430 RepID=A0A7S1TW01_9STRA|mmetsp:Transcript_19768/g.59867  ORF Transcript_19768/g.59867 Transcript_19768/m.59867 type:complete len:111 (+) Transcript_19768:113-445(+)|eukprot:CAMPEP_0118854116 /NCGR_PEP_ID=MMETSP1163-20130328/2450_1 /TAXON_ID=124430 /ORGANISM="Phaeomonas parva, Strain CCMP2877" /LENGTH=110 /DNA_ID=CAMNT_0006786783 /DNA_START=108 /DNA_END=440 /DNA_ORIENTATION=-
MESLGEVYAGFKEHYVASTTTRMMLCDMLTATAVATTAVQAVYCFLLGSFPFNSFLAGLFCSMGIAVLTISLRLQLGGGSEFEGRTPEKAFVDYIICVMVLMLAVFNFMG